MALFVNTNHSALRAMGDLSSTQRSLSDTFRKISSGQRVNRAADDAAGLAVAENLDAKKSSARVANRNIQDGISVIQTYEGAANEIGDILKRQRELAVQASSETLADTERAYAHQEFYTLQREHERIAGTTNFNGMNLTHNNPADPAFGPEGGPDPINARLMQVQAGVNGTSDDQITLSLRALNVEDSGGPNPDKFTFAQAWEQHVVTKTGASSLDAANDDVVDWNQLLVEEDFATSAGFGANKFGVASAEQAQASIEFIDFSLDYVNSARSQVGAQQNRLESALNNLETFTENTAAAESRIRDADFAFETAEMSKLQVMQQAGTAILGQANGMNQAALRLI